MAILGLNPNEKKITDQYSFNILTLVYLHILFGSLFGENLFNVTLPFDSILSYRNINPNEEKI